MKRSPQKDYLLLGKSLLFCSSSPSFLSLNTLLSTDSYILCLLLLDAENGHSSIQQGAGNQQCSQTTGADKNILKTMAPYTTGVGSTPAAFKFIKF